MKADAPLALVTGASRRVGRAIALGLARDGHDIVVHYGGSEEAAESTADDIRTLGRQAITAQADLRDPEAIERLFHTVASLEGALNVLVNSAASFNRRAFLELTVAEWTAALDVNLRAPLLCTQHAARLMRGPRGDGHGAIVNIADLSGEYAWPGYAAHGISKAGLIHLTRIAARELGPSVRVNAVVPGAILPPPGMSQDDPEWLAKGSTLPVGSVGDPTHVAATVVFVASNPFISGEVVHVDGGEQLLGPHDHA